MFSNTYKSNYKSFWTKWKISSLLWLRRQRLRLSWDSQLSSSLKGMLGIFCEGLLADKMTFLVLKFIFQTTYGLDFSRPLIWDGSQAAQCPKRRWKWPKTVLLRSASFLCGVIGRQNDFPASKIHIWDHLRIWFFEAVNLRRIPGCTVP